MAKRPEPKLTTTHRVPGRAPDVTVNTGLTSDVGATTLDIYYDHGKTFVVPCGEVYNAEPWYYRGTELPSDVRRWYRAAMR